MAVKTEAMATKAPENILYNKLPPSAEDGGVISRFPFTALYNFSVSSCERSRLKATFIFTDVPV